MGIETQFELENIPYDILEEFGLIQEMIDDLPEDVTLRLLSGGKTPVLPIVRVNDNGEEVHDQAKISLVRLNDGRIDVSFSPRWDDKELGMFTEEQQDMLAKGMVTMAAIPGKGDCYVQFDETINQALAVPEDIIRHNIAIYADKFGLQDEEISTLENGGVVETVCFGHVCSFGIDLKEDECIRVVNGNTQAWERSAAVENLNKYNFATFGCWVVNDNNSMTWYRDGEWPEDVEEQFKLQGLQNASKQQNRYVAY